MRIYYLSLRKKEEKYILNHELKTWQDLAKKYSLVLFNNCINLGDGEVMDEWAEQHECGDDDDEESDT